MKAKFSENRNALKRVSKLSDWFVKHRSFCAKSMRNHLGAILEERHGAAYRMDRAKPTASRAFTEELQPTSTVNSKNIKTTVKPAPG